MVAEQKNVPPSMEEILRAIRAEYQKSGFADEYEENETGE